MFVKSIMIPKYKCITGSQDESLNSILKKLDEHQLDGLPVLDGEKYAGVVTRHRIYQSFFNAGIEKEEFLEKTSAAEIAAFKDHVLQGDEIFETTLLMLKDFPILAVVDDHGRFLGGVTRFDVLEQFQSAFGMNRKGVRIAFTSVETEGRIKRLAEIAHQLHEQIISLVTFDETDKLVRRIVMKIEKKDNLEKFIQKLEESGFRVLDIYED